MDFEKLPRFKGFQLDIHCQIPVWADAYRVEQTEIERQIDMAHVWAVNNPKRAPRKDIMRYLNNWMALAEQKGSMRRQDRRSGQDRRVVNPDPEPDMSYEEMVEIRKRNFAS